MTMLWYPAVVALAVCNAVLLIGIALATGSRRHEGGAEHELAMLSSLAVDAAKTRFMAVNGAAVVSLPRREDTSPALLVERLSDPDSTIRREAAAAAGAVARGGYPQPLDRVVVDQLLRLLEEEQVHGVLVEAIDALAYSLDARTPPALLRRIPSSRGSMRERLIEAGALFAHLAQSAEHAAVEAGV